MADMNLAPVKAAAERESLDPDAAGRLIHPARRSAKLPLVTADAAEPAA
jgi:hypothetical protein